MLLFGIGQSAEMSNFGIFFLGNPLFNRPAISAPYLLNIDVHVNKKRLPYVKKCGSGDGPKLVETHFLAKSDHFGPLLKLVAVELSTQPSHHMLTHT
jgi:hypothetical protein